MSEENRKERFVKEIALSVIVAIIGTILYFVIEKATTNMTYSILVAISVVFALSLVWVYWYLKKREKVYTDNIAMLGLKKIYNKFDDAPSTLDIITDAKTTVEFFGISARTFFEFDDTEEIVKKKIKEGVSFKFLILHPNSPYVTIKAKDEGDDPEAWKHDIQGSLSRINRVAKETSEQRVVIRTYDTQPIWRCIFVDDKIAYTTYYPHGHRGKHSPVFLLENKETSLYDPLYDYFKFIWDLNGGGDE